MLILLGQCEAITDWPAALLWLSSSSSCCCRRQLVVVAKLALDTSNIATVRARRFSLPGWRAKCLGLLVAILLIFQLASISMTNTVAIGCRFSLPGWGAKCLRLLVAILLVLQLVPSGSLGDSAVLWRRSPLSDGRAEEGVGVAKLFCKVPQVCLSGGCALLCTLPGRCRKT